MVGGTERKRGLGRGLSALMSDVAETEERASAGPSAADRKVPIEQITPNPDQPRKRFAEGELGLDIYGFREKLADNGLKYL